MKTYRRLAATALLASLGSAAAEVRLPSIFSNHAVLIQAEAVPVWGWADPGEKVRVTLGGSTAETAAGSDGRWRVKLDLRQHGADPASLIVSGKNTLTVHDVVVGQVWLCSGQSNMEWTLAKSADYQVEKDLPPDPMIRQFKVERRPMESPQEDCAGQWVISALGARGAFSAVGYFFQKQLVADVGQPVGVINSSYGGTPIEAWMGAEAFASHPGLNKGKERALARVRDFAAQQNLFSTDLQSWLKRHERQDKATADVVLYTGTIEETGWKPVEMPNLFASVGLTDSGAIWMRRKVQIPAKAAGKEIHLRLGLIKGFDQVFWNGVPIGSTMPSDAGSADERRYKIPRELVTVGEATLAVRVFCPQGGGGMVPSQTALRANEDLPLKGRWLAKAEYELPSLPAEAMRSFPKAPSKPPAAADLPTGLFNGMIAPLVPYGLSGVLWYQGENNLSRAFLYREELPLLVRSWRELWRQGDIPFYVCQLPNFQAKRPEPEDSTWPVMRESQAEVLAQPKTGVAALLDVGEANTIHPLDKKTPGERLAALVQAQGPLSPVYKAMEIEGDKIRVIFGHEKLGLVAASLPESYQPKSDETATLPLIKNSPKSQLQGFAICGSDRMWKWADARIEGDSVIVSSPAVPAPVAVRYAWATNPTINLYSTAGHPIPPFRTDSFEVITQDREY